MDTLKSFVARVLTFACVRERGMNSASVRIAGAEKGIRPLPELSPQKKQLPVDLVLPFFGAGCDGIRIFCGKYFAKSGN